MKVFVYGGAFNPPHIGHQSAILHLLVHDPLAEIWLLPTYAHAFDKKLIAFEDRVELLNLVIDDIQSHRIRICDIERHLPKPNYTYHTLTYLSTHYPEHEFCFCIGADNLTEAYRWYQFDEIINRWGLYVFGRQGHRQSYLKYQEQYRSFSKVVFGAMLPDISSSDIRDILSPSEDDSLARDIKVDSLKRMIAPSCLDKVMELYAQTQVVIFGKGKAGTAINQFLREQKQNKNLKIITWSRSDGTAFPAWCEIQQGLWLFCISDGAIQSFSEQLYLYYQNEIAQLKHKNKLPLIAHVSGVHSYDILTPWSEKGFKVFALHPLQSLRDQDSAQDLKKSYFSLTSPLDQKEEVIACLEKIIPNIRSRSMFIPSEKKGLYHLSAVIASNLTMILVAKAIELFQLSSGLSEEEARERIMPLVDASLSRIHQSPANQAFTGPAQRKDFATLNKHLYILKNCEHPQKTEILEIYQKITNLILNDEEKI